MQTIRDYILVLDGKTLDLYGKCYIPSTLPRVQAEVDVLTTTIATFYYPQNASNLSQFLVRSSIDAVGNTIERTPSNRYDYIFLQL